MGAAPASAPERLGPYLLDRLIGKGGMAEVYEAFRAGARGFNKRFALKRIRPDLAHDPEFAELFCREARVGARLSHPNVVQVIDFGEHAGELFMVMEYVEGLSCAALLRSLGEAREKIPLGAAIYISRRVLRGLHYVHTVTDDDGTPLGLVHRDVSPGNVLVGRLGEVKLSDFGIAQDSCSRERLGRFRGKPSYMSPEQLTGGRVDARSDLFAVGAVMAELLLGRPVFEGAEGEVIAQVWAGDLSRLDELGRAVPGALSGVLHRALAHAPERRFQSAAELDSALGAIVQEHSLDFSELEMASFLAQRALGAGSGTRVLHRASLPSISELPGVRLSLPPRTSLAPGDRGSMLPTLPPAREARPTLPAPRVDRVYQIESPPGSRQLVGVPALLERIATGRAGPKQRVSVDGRRFVELDSLELYAQLADRAAFGLSRPLPLPPSWRRELQRPDLPLALFGLARAGRSGVLELVSGSRRKRVYLRSGNPALVVSTDRGELFGARLVREGLVRSRDVDAALVLASETPGMRLGEALVVMGLLSPELVTERLYEQLVERFLEVGSWAACTASFTEGVSPGGDGFEVGASGLELVAHAVNEAYDDLEISLFLGPFHQGPLVRRAWLDDLGALGLSAAQERALVRAPGATRLDLLLTEMAHEQVSPHDTLRAVFLGLAAGLLFMPGWPESPRRGSVKTAPAEFGPEEHVTAPSPAEWFFASAHGQRA